jgi:hypothetical protein
VERWYLAIDKGELSVSHRNARADAVLRADKALFELILTGKTNAMAAILRGALLLEGDFRLAVRVERLFPGPPSSLTLSETDGKDKARHPSPRRSAAKAARPPAKAARPAAKATRKAGHTTRPTTKRKGAK